MRHLDPISLIIFTFVLLAACVPPAPLRQEQPLRVGLLPITDVIPFYVAQSQGYYQQENIQVTLTPVSSGAERDTLIQTGQIDCQLTDLHNVILTNAGENVQLRVISTAHQATPQRGQFFLITPPGKEIATVADLVGGQLGISENTIIDYWADRILTHMGTAPESVTMVNVAQIPVRLELLLSGQLDGAILPDPLAALAQLQGGHLLVDDTVLPEVGTSILSCSADFIAARRSTVASLLAAWDLAVEDINQDPDQFQNILIENTRVPEPLQDQYRLPVYPVATLPTLEQVADVANWALEKGLIQTIPAYADIVDSSFRQ